VMAAAVGGATVTTRRPTPRRTFVDLDMLHLRVRRTSLSNRVRRWLTLMSETNARGLEPRVAHARPRPHRAQFCPRVCSAGMGGARRALARTPRGGTMFSRAVGRENR